MANSATISQSQNVRSPAYSQKRNATPAGTMGPARKAISQVFKLFPIRTRFQPVQNTSPVSAASPDFKTACRKPQAFPTMKYEIHATTKSQNHAGAPTVKKGLRSSRTTPE